MMETRSGRWAIEGQKLELRGPKSEINADYWRDQAQIFYFCT